MTERRDIESRLLNWAAWANGSEGGGRAACMTGAICEAMRRAELGPISNGGDGPRWVDSADAYLVARAMVKLHIDQRRILGLHYVDGQRKGWIAARLRFPVAQYDVKMGEAQAAIDSALSALCKNSNSK